MLARLLLPVWLCLLACAGSGTVVLAQESAASEAPAQAADDGHAAKPLTMSMSNSDIFKQQFSHSVPYAIFKPKISADESINRWFWVYNVQPWQWVSIGLLFVLFMPVLLSFKSGRASWGTRVLRGFCLWVRDDLVYSVMGKEVGRPFVPFFMFVFFFLVVQNVIGLVPAVAHGFPFTVYTATGTPYVTVAFAAVTLLLMLGLGMKKNGVLGFFTGLVPHGVPVLMWPMMFVIELVSLCVKPFALTIRLFANMLAGHLVIAAAIGLVFLFAKMLGGSVLAHLTALPCVGMAVFIYIIEAFVTLLQAYIFALLSVTFVYQSMHQEH